MSDEKYYLKMCGNARLTFTESGDLVDIMIRQDGNFVQVSGADFMELIEVASKMAKERVEIKTKQLEESRLKSKTLYDSLPEPQNPHQMVQLEDLTKKCRVCGVLVSWVSEVIGAQTEYKAFIPLEKLECPGAAGAQAKGSSSLITDL